MNFALPNLLIHNILMYICSMYSNELIKGTLRPIVMKLLLEHGRMYGYEITQRVRVLTNEQIQITEGALYPLLHKLEKDKLVKTEKEYIGKRVRKYYLLTKKGEKLAQEKVSELLDFMETIKSIMKFQLS